MSPVGSMLLTGVCLASMNLTFSSCSGVNGESEIKHGFLRNVKVFTKGKCTLLKQLVNKFTCSFSWCASCNSFAIPVTQVQPKFMLFFPFSRPGSR